jgi:predicted Rossmann fold flavoprotein
MFPTTDQSESIVHCLLQTATRAGVQLRTRCGVDQLERSPDGSWLAVLSGAPSVRARRVLIATGGCRSGNVPALLLQLGHTLAKPVPSLFTFHVHTPWVQGLAGLALEAEAEIPAINLRERGPVLFTHWGLSGPAILRLSAWGARGLEETDYHFPLHISWLPGKKPEALHVEFQEIRRQHPGKAVVNLAAGGVPARLWEVLCRNAGISSSERWNQLPRTSVDKLIQNLLRTELQVTGKSLHKDEFVTCGGVRLQDVDLRSMESRITPALYFAGEVLDIDGITGGFNFQAAWTTGWIAGRAIAMQPPALF